MSGYYDLYIRKSGGVTLNLQEKTVIPLAIGNIITADEPYNGLSKVIISSEPDLIPANIKLGKNIYGVTANGLIRLNFDGTVDTSFNVGTGADNNKISTILYL